MYTDLQGHELTGATRESLACYQQAVTAFHFYQGDPFALLDSALSRTPDFAMARIAKVLMLALSSEPGCIAQAGQIDIDADRLNSREQSLYGAARPLVEGRWRDAGRALDLHAAQFPLDLLAVQCGHLIDFYCADSRNLRERIARVLPEWDRDIPGCGVLLGMYAFGLEEDGHYAHAEETGRTALDMEPYDCWAHHAVAHVMEMQGRPEDGIGWMIAREPFWSDERNFFKVHNWWHRALFHLELGQREEALAIYDRAVRKTPSAVALDMVDASALLWRLDLAGVDTGQRWLELAGMWPEHADGRTYPFNDWHAAMAFAGAGCDEALQGLIETMRSAAGISPVGDWIRHTGLPLVEGFAAFARGDHETAVAKLLPVRRFAGSFGGSHAQRDIIDLTLVEAACRGGLRDIGRALVNERRLAKPHSRMSHGFQMRVAVQNGPKSAYPASLVST